MNLETFNECYKYLKDVDMIEVDKLCDHPLHAAVGKLIAKQPARRNILKHGGQEFVCRTCKLKYDNPMNKVGEGNRQTDEEIIVFCPHPDHDGGTGRTMKKSCYYGEMKKPYIQVCKSCAQLGKVITEDQKEKIRHSLKGVERSDEFKQKLSEYMKNNPEGIERATRNLLEHHHTNGMLGKHHSSASKQKLSEVMTGRTYTDEHRQHISEGRKRMLAETGGFTPEHREKLSLAAARQYANGFDPQLHHRKGWHDSPKAGKVFYRSSYEKKAYLILDADDSVKTYKVEKIQISFMNPVKKTKATYLVDLYIEYVDGTKKIVEVKPNAWLTDEVIVAKNIAATEYAKKHDVSFEVWTEVQLFGPVYNEKHIRSFTDLLDNDSGDGRKESARRRTAVYYQKHIASDKVGVFCNYCNETHKPLRLTYEKNISRNGRYICEAEGGHISGSKPKKKKVNPYADQGKKQCIKCSEIKLFADFNVDKGCSDGYSNKCSECNRKACNERYNRKNSRANNNRTP